MSDTPGRRVRRIAAVAATLLVAVAAVPAGAAADPDAPAAGSQPGLTLVGQDRINAPAGTAVTFTVRVPSGLDTTALADPAGTGELRVTSYSPLERFQPPNSLPLDNRGRVQSVLRGTLPPALADNVGNIK